MHGREGLHAQIAAIATFAPLVEQSSAVFVWKKAVFFQPHPSSNPSMSNPSIPDKRARQILFDTHWSSSGWRSDHQNVNEVDFGYAKSMRTMFDPVTLGHSEALSHLQGVANKLTERMAADAFLASLSTRRLDWRSVLGSYSVARHMPSHELTAGEGQCRVCGLCEGKRTEDLNVLNFERLKWGGVRHSNPVYGALDMELFLDSAPPAPNADDLRIFRDLVAAVRDVGTSVSSAALQGHFPASLKSNKAERDRRWQSLDCAASWTPQSTPDLGSSSFHTANVRYLTDTLSIWPTRHAGGAATSG